MWLKVLSRQNPIHLIKCAKIWLHQKTKESEMLFSMFSKKRKFSTSLENFRICGNIAPDYEIYEALVFILIRFRNFPHHGLDVCAEHTTINILNILDKYFMRIRLFLFSKSGTICIAGRFWRIENSFVGSSDLFSIWKPLIKNLELSEMGSQDQNRLNIAEQKITWD